MKKTYDQLYYEAHKEKIKATVKKHRESPEYRKKQQEWNNKWRLKVENKEIILAIRRKSQRKINGLLKIAGFVTKEIRNRILLRDSNQCLCCQKTENLTIDHIIPVTKGGITVEENLQTLCASCNSKKQQRIISYRNLKKADFPQTIVQ